MNELEDNASDESEMPESSSSEETVYILSKEDLLKKNTESFQCLAQIEISRSSLLRDPLYFFPEIEDPHLDRALWEYAEPPDYDAIGIERYKDLCKKEKIIPFRRVLNSLHKHTLDLKFFALSEKAMRTICETLQNNNYVRNLILQENYLKPEAVAHLVPLLKINREIKKLDLKQCQIGSFGAEQLGESFAFSKNLESLDLSHNNLGDEGIEYLAEGLEDNASIKILNLSHNSLGDSALIALKDVMANNFIIQELDLSWNYLYSPIGIRALFEGLSENNSLTNLNLSWNGIGDKDTFRYISAHLKEENCKLKHLNLSNNRISGLCVKLLRASLRWNESLISLDLSYNPISADEAELICTIFNDTKTLKSINLCNVWVKKEPFIPLLKMIDQKGCNVILGGILSNYILQGPDIKGVLLNRAKFVAMKQKKKKLRKDIGQFIIQLKDESISKEDFVNMYKKQKIKIDNDLAEMIMKTFNDKKKVSLQDIRENYLRLYPDTVYQPPKKKKKKGKKKKK